VPAVLARSRLHTLQIILLVAPVLLFSVIAHEIAHGYAALRQGDTTALEAGRLTWNPVKHIDPFFTIILPLIMLTGSWIAGKGGLVIGGAKPVPVDPRNYRHPRRGDIIVSLAGVFTNLLVGVGCAILIVITGLIARNATVLVPTLGIIQAMLVIGILLNAGLIAFNLLPIPPLDGSHVVKYLLPRPLAIQYVRFGRYGLLVLIVLLAVWRRGLDLWLYPAQWASGATIDALIRNGYVLAPAMQWLL
jgi:Zn-dependent protease